MPYEIKSVPGGYFVANKETDKLYSNKPMELSKAEAQLRTLEKSIEKEKANDLEKYIDFDTLKNTVLNIKCRKINVSEVEAIKTKKELIKYLKDNNCPVLKRQESLLESIYNK